VEKLRNWLLAGAAAVVAVGAAGCGEEVPGEPMALEHGTAVVTKADDNPNTRPAGLSFDDAVVNVHVAYTVNDGSSATSEELSDELVRTSVVEDADGAEINGSSGFFVMSGEGVEIILAFPLPDGVSARDLTFRNGEYQVKLSALL
jgi:hypothetical protein